MTKKCSRCGIEKSLSEFTYKGNGKCRSECYQCRREEYHNNEKLREIARQRARDYYKNNKDKVIANSLEKYKRNLPHIMWSNAKKRAEKQGVPFDISEEDIVIPDKCPVLGIPLFVSKNRPTANSPTLDKIIPSKGYVKGNIMVISHKANTIKSNATAEELMKVATFYEDLLRS